MNGQENRLHFHISPWAAYLAERYPEMREVFEKRLVREAERSGRTLPACIHVGQDQP